MNLTLRDRLQNRRERIAAGLPLQEPVTMTENFFKAAMTATAMRTCPECKREFKPHGKQVVCSSECGAKRWPTSRGRRVEYEPRVCAADGCDVVFTPVRSNHATCGKSRCQRSHQRAKQREYNATFYAKKKRQAERDKLAAMLAEADRKATANPGIAILRQEQT